MWDMRCEMAAEEARSQKQEARSRMDERPRVGGQAVIEGVMMVVPGAVAVVVRRPSGDMGSMVRRFISLTRRKRLLKFPPFRGAIALIEMLRLGFEALTFSAGEAVGDEVKAKGSLALTATLVLALLLGIGLFVYLPIFLTGAIGIGRNQLAFNLVAGVIRVCFFILYLWSITRIPDVRRVFAYHGAEHKSVGCFEAGEELTLENARKHSIRHPRCGTSYLLVVLIFAVLLFAVADTIVFGKLGIPSRAAYRFGLHLLLLPIVAGISYEFTRIAGRSRLAGALSGPGLFLQRLTTREPSEDQIEIGLEALKLALSEARRHGDGEI